MKCKQAGLQKICNAFCRSSEFFGYANYLVLYLLKFPKMTYPNNFIADRPKAALLFWFFGDFRCGALFLWLFSLYIKIKIDTNSC